VPGSIVEAVGGGAETSLSADSISHHNQDSASSSSSSTSSTPSKADTQQILTHLLTRWTVHPFPYKPPPVDAPPQQGSADIPARDTTEVTLALEFQFASPVYAAMSQAVAPRVADVLIKAFEERVRSVLEPGGHAKTQSGRVGRLEGVMKGGQP